jgi:drug/metabolite transporter (DMT)-like permease
MTIAQALGAALLFAVGTVLQRRVAAAAGADEARRASFLATLARRPVWLAGMGADALGYGLQAAALAHGRLAVVQPLLATSLVFALLLAGRRPTRRELLGAGLVTGGLALFLGLAQPAGGAADASTAAWLVAFAVTGLVCAGAWRLARGAAATRRALLLGSATGVLFGLSAALTKATVAQLDAGVLLDWHAWALVLVGYASVALAQASLQAGALGAAVATQMALDPCAALLLGVLAFHERFAGSVAGAVAGVAVVLAGVSALATADSRSPRRSRTAARP